MAFIQLDYNDWVEQFKPITKPGTDHIGFDSHYDVELLKDRPDCTIWTLVSCPCNEWVIINGYWRVNRMEYYTTEVPYDPKDRYNVE